MPRVKKETYSEKTERTSAKGTQPKHSAIFTAEQLERMTTHELADMLSNIVMLLRRMPDVPCQELVAQASSAEHSTDITPFSPAISTPTISTETATVPTSEQENNAQNGQNGQNASLQERIDALMNDKKMTVPRLKVMADELGIPYPTNPKKAELAKRIAERQARGHSEQYAIMNL